MGCYAGPDASESSLVLCLDAANLKSYVGSGATWADLSGRNNNGTLGITTSAPTYNSENNGYLNFDGVNDYVDFFAPNLGTTTTVEMWCNIGTGYTGKMIMGWFTYDIWCDNGRLGYNTGVTDIYGISSSTVISLGLINNWKHYIFEMRSDVPYTNNKMYINAVSQTLSQQQGSEDSFARNFNNGNGRISGWRSITNYPIPMKCSYFNVYNRALTTSEIQQNFNATRGRYGV